MPSIEITVFDAASGTTSEYSFDGSPVRIGRNPLNDLTLPFPFVSGWHAVVRFDEHGAKFFDLGSTNGTLHNGRRIGAGESIHVGEQLAVTIGKVELQIRRRAVAQPPALSAPQPGPMQPNPMQPNPMQPNPMQPGPMQPGPMQPNPMPPGPVGGSRGFVPTGPLPAATAPASPPSPQPYPPQPHGPYGGHAPRGYPAPVSDQGSAPLPGPPAPAGGKPGSPGIASGTIDSEHRSPPAGVGEGTAHVEMSDVHQLVHRLRPTYQAYEQASQAMRTELERAMEPMPPHMHAFALSILARELPELTSKPEFQSLQERAGLRPSGPVAPAGGGTDVAAIARLARSLRVDEEPPRSPEEAERFLSCVEDVLRAAAKAMVELQKGQEQFGNEMGVRTIKEYTALHAAGTPENVLRYLLDWQSGGPHRTKELVGIYADLMIHQVALINGVMEGVRSLLARLAPEEIERNVGGAFGKASAAWKAYGERYAELCREDRKITEAVFGGEFARAYAEVGGEGR